MSGVFFLDKFRLCYLKKPRVICIIPAKKVVVKASRRYSAGFAVGSISFRSIVPIRRETTATGPIAISLELPIKAYIIGGTKLESEMERVGVILS